MWMVPQTGILDKFKKSEALGRDRSDRSGNLQGVSQWYFYERAPCEPFLSGQILFSWPQFSVNSPKVQIWGHFNSPTGKMQPGHPSVISVFPSGSVHNS